MSDKIFTFKGQLELGNRGEQLFLDRYPRRLEVYPGKEYDFIVKSSREKIELKTDNFNINKTDNFFFERYSDIVKKSPGGPWRALKDEVDIFVYYFIRHNIWFEFNNIPELVKVLNHMTEKKNKAGEVKQKGLIYVKNNGYITGGFTVNREELKDLYTVWEF